jgi:glyceraldehyde-3-phosphate dehydrogenase (NADP+) (phosphorylating)
LDAIHCDKRRARAAALNIVPASTDISKTISLVLPNLTNKLSGIAMRVPTPTVSMVDLVVNVGRKGITVEDVKRVFKTAAANESLKGILAVCDEPLVSMDFRGSFASATVDTTLTMVVGEDMIKVVAWYDNEWGYSQRVLDLVHTVQAKWAEATGESFDVTVDSICGVDPDNVECKIHDT